MKIYTKKGDLGETSLVGGKRVSKASQRVCAYGDIDELISYIGVLRASISDCDGFLRDIQQALMNGSAHVASEGDAVRLAPFPENAARALEEEIDRMYAVLPEQKAFILPSAPESAAFCHVARCVCRRAERSVVALGDSRGSMVSVLQYLNRLSDYLYALGRYVCYRENVPEDFWIV
ncbi:MAG TPA: cob(I)yrinic acid a,c-diamide adenosyltransferase [Candidatus Coprenecus stercoripullorum]|nr:cob(I)yrinic acid a,c-diamide adenosyltransferase [Candidatus Coprenecus stercoripullorum]